MGEKADVVACGAARLWDVGRVGKIGRVGGIGSWKVQNGLKRKIFSRSFPL
ncbi:MAG: hypothetical protein MW690_000576 [Methanophagales archaeon]|nr:hypothetical protein [Methanophagales archaeon]